MSGQHSSYQHKKHKQHLDEGSQVMSSEFEKYDS